MWSWFRKRAESPTILSMTNHTLKDRRFKFKGNYLAAMAQAKGSDIPGFIYGTAWKEDNTERLVRTALEAGFRGIDTANQRRQYFEEGVGKAISGALEEGTLTRGELFIQTKFTYPNGQDHRIPYDIKAKYPAQVSQSLKSSLEHLNVERLDSYVLHGPAGGYGLMPSDWEVWKEMERLQSEGKTRYLGVSNINLEQLQELVAQAEVKPRFVQNRCFAQAGWDREVREFCNEQDIIYQGFSLLTGNQFVLVDPRILQVAASLGKTPAQVVFRFAIQVGMLPLTGTSNPLHMKEDLASEDFTLTDDTMALIETIAFQR